MAKTTLLIMAAGMGSRFGSLKQLALLGPHERPLLHYTVYDAIEAGFDKIVFIIRKSFAEEFKQLVGSYAEKRIETVYCYQEMDRLPGNLAPVDRPKPWGTSHAIWCAKEAINEPFAVINADDFYGREAYKIMHNFLVASREPHGYAMVGYRLDATLSEFGTVSRGVCHTDMEGYLERVNECTKIAREGDVIRDAEQNLILAADAPVSMNFWGFTPTLFTEIERQFIPFYNANKENPKSEIFIPKTVDQLIREERCQVKLLPTDAKWFGVTYKEDTDSVNASLAAIDSQYPNL